MVRVGAVRNCGGQPHLGPEAGDEWVPCVGCGCSARVAISQPLQEALMLPPKTDPRWTQILSDKSTPAVESLATKMLLMRVKQMLTFDPRRLAEAITVAHDFFSKNEAMCQQDLAILFGSEKR